MQKEYEIEEQWHVEFVPYFILNRKPMINSVKIIIQNWILASNAVFLKMGIFWSKNVRSQESSTFPNFFVLYRMSAGGSEVAAEDGFEWFVT